MITIRPLTAASLPDFLHFFDHVAFSDNPKWASCYCHFPHADHSRVEWKTRGAEENRAAICGLACKRRHAGAAGKRRRADRRLVQRRPAAADRQLLRPCRPRRQAHRLDRLLRHRLRIGGAAAWPALCWMRLATASRRRVSSGPKAIRRGRDDASGDAPRTARDVPRRRLRACRRGRGLAEAAQAPGCISVKRTDRPDSVRRRPLAKPST